MILVTGASGKTGKAILRAVSRRGLPARALVRHAAQMEELLTCGATEVVPGDLTNPSDLERAFHGVHVVYHICPNMHPEEEQIAANVIAAARQAGVSKFVYHSVMHPQTEEMAHHWAKLRVEGMIFQSGLPFSILQPCAYMQNVLAYLQPAREQGIYALPYAPSTRISMVDLDDVAETAARVIAEDGHEYAIYELAGPQALSQSEVAECLSRHLGREVHASLIDRADWKKNAQTNGMSDYAIRTLLGMFEYYEWYHFIGNSNILSWLLGRSPHRFDEFLQNLDKDA